MSEHKRLIALIQEYEVLACNRPSRGLLARLLPVDSLLHHPPKTIATQLHTTSQKVFTKNKKILSVTALILGMINASAVLSVIHLIKRGDGPLESPIDIAALISVLTGVVCMPLTVMVPMVALPTLSNYSNITITPSDTGSTGAMVHFADQMGHKLKAYQSKSLVCLTEAALTLEGLIERSERTRLAVAAAATLAVVATGAVALYKYFKRDSAPDTVES